MVSSRGVPLEMRVARPLCGPPFKISVGLTETVMMVLLPVKAFLRLASSSANLTLLSASFVLIV